MNDDQTCHVWSGELRVGQGTQVLTALLGSCVGIGMIWRSRRRCGLAHCFLPASDGPDCMYGARYVNLAVPSLLQALGVREENYAEVEVIVAGGARMISALYASEAVGRRNVAAAQECLNSRGLRVAYADVGGSLGRRLTIDCEQQSYSVTKIAAPEQESRHAGA